MIPRQFNRYIEPFLGGGSMFFHLQPKRAILGDKNNELIECYKAVKADWARVEESLRYRQIRHWQDPQYYYTVRDHAPRTRTELASRFIYLNRTCFNGLYRVNRRGVFNVPKGSRDGVVEGRASLKLASEALRAATLRAEDFESLISLATAGDFIFADPPYTVQHDTNGFLKYNETLFSWQDQERLAMSLRNAVARGATVMSTNANHRSVRRLYSSTDFRLRTGTRLSSLGGEGATRGTFRELIIMGDAKE